MKKKILNLSLLGISLLALTACGEKEKVADSEEKPTITFVHQYYHSEEEYPAAQVMRDIYQEFADEHKDEFNFIIEADQSGAEGIYNTALNKIGAGEFYDIADFAAKDIVPIASKADMILDLKEYIDEDPDFKEGIGIGYEQNLTSDGKIYTVRDQIEAQGFWYNEKLFKNAGAKTPDEWLNWTDFNEAVDTLQKSGIEPFGLNAGWPTDNLLTALFQKNSGTREFYQTVKEKKDFSDENFTETMEFLNKNVLDKTKSENFGPGGDSDEQYRYDFLEGEVAMMFNGVWDASSIVDSKVGGDIIKPAIFPTDESGKKTSLMTGGTGFVVSNKLSEAQTEAAIEFIKYMTSTEVAERIMSEGIAMAPRTNIDYETLKEKADNEAVKKLIEAIEIVQSAEYKAVGFDNTLGDFAAEIRNKYAGLQTDTKTVEEIVTDLEDYMKANE